MSIKKISRRVHRTKSPKVRRSRSRSKVRSTKSPKARRLSSRSKVRSRKVRLTKSPKVKRSRSRSKVRRTKSPKVRRTKVRRTKSPKVRRTKVRTAKRSRRRSVQSLASMIALGSRSPVKATVPLVRSPRRASPRRASPRKASPLPFKTASQSELKARKFFEKLYASSNINKDELLDKEKLWRKLRDQMIGFIRYRYTCSEMAHKLKGKIFKFWKVKDVRYDQSSPDPDYIRNKKFAVDTTCKIWKNL